MKRFQTRDPRLGSAPLFPDVNRLRAQMQLSWARELAVLQRAGLSDGMVILDVGCGPAFVSEALLDAFPRCRVIGVELDAAMVSSARDRLHRFRDRHAIVEASATGLFELPDGAFDFVVARYLLQHLPLPRLAVAEMFRVLKPGGRAALIDIDDALGGIISPACPAMGRVTEQVRRRQAAYGGNREIGRQLPSLLGAHGFERVALEILALDSREVGRDAFAVLFDAVWHEGLLADGWITADDLEGWRAETANLLGGPDAFIMELIMIAHGSKPAICG